MNLSSTLSRGESRGCPKERKSNQLNQRYYKERRLLQPAACCLLPTRFSTNTQLFA